MFRITILKNTTLVVNTHGKICHSNFNQRSYWPFRQSKLKVANMCYKLMTNGSQPDKILWYQNDISYTNRCKGAEHMIQNKYENG
jgi:hypothetical protein